jgi:membrane-associated phospholipid phosphatase
MDELIKFCAKYLIIIPVVVDLYILWRLPKSDRRRMYLTIALGGIITVVLAALSSQLFHDPRPQYKDGSVPLLPHGNDNGFPSDHSLLASFLAWVAYGFNKKAGYLLMAVAVIIGWARVAAHVHHTADIIGSFVISAIGYFAAVYLIERSLGKKSTKA